MTKYDFDKDVYDFPLPVDLHGKETWFMVQAVIFTGGMFYTVRGENITTLNIICTYDDGEEGTSHFTVMNEDTSRNDVVAAILQALRQPPDTDSLPEGEIPG